MTLARQLKELISMSPSDLRDQWRARVGTEAPRLSTDLLQRMLGHALQEKALGGLASADRRVLQRVASGREDVGLKPGMRLIRQWNGKTIAVMVTPDGFIWEDRPYRSLSAIARAVTGTAWSGPRFFGLNGHG